MDISAQGPSSNGIYIPLQDQSFSDSNRQNQYYQQGYQAPQQPQQIIVNQPISPKVIYIDSSNFRNSPCSMNCPFCKNQISTEVKKHWNWLNCFFCCWAGIFCWASMQFCRNKEFNCYDSEHFCPVCHNKIGDYSSC